MSISNSTATLRSSVVKISQNSIIVKGLCTSRSSALIRTGLRASIDGANTI